MEEHKFFSKKIANIVVLLLVSYSVQACYEIVVHGFDNTDWFKVLFVGSFYGLFSCFVFFRKTN